MVNDIKKMPFVSFQSMQYVDEVTEPNELNEVVSLFNESALPGVFCPNLI